MVKFMETERMAVARDWGGGRMGSYLIGTKFQFGKVNIFWRWMVA